MSEKDRQYVLSRMSRADLVRCILLQPTVHLRSTDNNTGYEATYEHEPLMNLYFTRDQSITTPRGHIICNMNSTQRSPETSLINLCYEHLGRKPILHITGEGRLEGGDYIPAGNISLIGCGMRTNDEGIRQIMEEDELHYANNFLAIAPRHIMAVGGQSEELQTRFREAGVTVEWIPLESLIDGYGAAHCMTQVLERQTCFAHLA